MVRDTKLSLIAKGVMANNGDKKALEEMLTHLYKTEKKKFTEISERLVAFKPNHAYGHVYIDIERMFTNKDTGLPFETRFMGAIHIFGNIDGKTGHGLFWLDAATKKTILGAADAYISLRKDVEENIEVLEKQYPGVKVSHAIIAHEARNS